MLVVRRTYRLVAVVAALCMAGCGGDLVVEVESNTSWSGYFHNRSVDGSGDETVDVPEESIVCATVQKGTEGGTLTVRMVRRDVGIFQTDNEEDSASTSAAYGVVSVCSDSDY